MSLLGTSRRELLIGGAMAGTAALTFAALPRRRTSTIPAKALDDAVPMQLGPWHFAGGEGLVLPPDDEQRLASAYDRVLARVYQDAAGTNVMLLMAYTAVQTGMLQIHRPESCYPAAGFALQERPRVPIALSPAVDVQAIMFTATATLRTEQLIYWTRIGAAFPDSWDAQRATIVRQNFEGVVPDGLLVRLSQVSPDPAGSAATLHRFARDLAAALPPVGRALLLGPRERP